MTNYYFSILFLGILNYVLQENKVSAIFRTLCMRAIKCLLNSQIFGQIQHF